MRDKVQKIETNFISNLLKIIVWIVIIFVIFKGLTGIFCKDIAAPDNKIVTQTKDYDVNITSFAENFAKEYMTYNGDNTEYQQRMKTYGEFRKTESKISTVSSVKTVNFNKIDEKYIVDCQVSFETKMAIRKNLIFLVGRRVIISPKSTKKIIHSNPTEKVIIKTPTPTIKPTEIPTVPPTPSLSPSPVLNTNILRVVITINDGNYKVESYTFIGQKQKTSTKEKNYKGIDVELAESEKIQSAVSGFLRAYMKSDPTIDYYLLKSKKVQGLDSKFTFKKIDKMLVKQNKKIYFAKIEYTVNDGINDFQQVMEFILVVKDKKYLIKEFGSNVNY